MQKNSRLRPFVLASALWIPLSLPAVAGTSSDAELLTRMHQEVQTLEQQVQTTYAQCQAGKRQACEQASQRQKQLARMQELIEGCQNDERESCTQLRDLRRR
jgi:TolA-binding protein